MSMAKSERTYALKALTHLWTGSVTFVEDAKGKLREKTRPGRLISTGLLGSIRWWFEVLVRGLGGSACDPSDTKIRCPDKDGNHCVVCELFGCTGWARKFRFRVLEKNGSVRAGQIKKGDEFRLRFTALRPIYDEEWALLDATLRLIADYGAMGGKTVFKPTEEPDRDKEMHHEDYGLVKIVNVIPPVAVRSVTELKNYVSAERWTKPEPNGKHSDFSWASLKCFWSACNKTLSREGIDRSSFNKVLGRNESKSCGACNSVHNPGQKCPETGKDPVRKSEQLLRAKDEVSTWLGGSQQESKKVFSFKDPPRTFGFVKPRLIDFDAMRQRLTDVWGQQGWNFMIGDEIIDQLFAQKEGRS